MTDKPTDAMAEARGEPVAWGLTFLGTLQTDAVYLTKGYAERELADRNARTPHDTDNRRLVPLYTHPAPSGGGWEPLADLRQHAINGWVAYGAQQMDQQTAHRNLDAYETALIRKVEDLVKSTVAEYIKNHSLMTLNRLNGKYRPMSVGEFRDELLSHLTQQDTPDDEDFQKE